MIPTQLKAAALLIAAQAVLASSLMSSPVLATDKIKGSRPAPPGCEWTPFVSAELGIRLLVAECKDIRNRYVFSTVGNKIEQHRPTDDRTFGSHRVLEVFSKKPDEPIATAIEAQFVSTLDPEAKASCKAQVLKRSPLHGDKQAYTILPTGAYAAAVDAALKQEPRDFGCGPYGAGQATTYFEYHPSESTVRFAFVEYGWDEPLFDENSIEFTK